MGARVHREPTEKHPRKKGRPAARQTAPPFDRLPGRPENATSQVQRGQIGKGRRTGAIRKINKEDDATAGVAAASEVARFRRDPPKEGNRGGARSGAQKRIPRTQQSKQTATRPPGLARRQRGTLPAARENVATRRPKDPDHLLRDCEISKIGQTCAPEQCANRQTGKAKDDSSAEARPRSREHQIDVARLLIQLPRPPPKLGLAKNTLWGGVRSSGLAYLAEEHVQRPPTGGHLDVESTHRILW